jgi:uncharacterized membrane protein
VPKIGFQDYSWQTPEILYNTPTVLSIENPKKFQLFFNSKKKVLIYRFICSYIGVIMDYHNDFREVFMKSKKLYLLVNAAVFAALICVCTAIISVPLPTGGYAHLGDGLVLLAGVILPLPYAAAAAGIGSALADIFSGYAIYAPITLVIKALCAITVFLLFKILGKLPTALKLPISAVAAELLMVGGYFFAEAVILGYGLGALGGIFGNAMQGLVGVIVCLALYLALSKTPLIHRSSNQSVDKTS